MLVLFVYSLFLRRVKAKVERRGGYQEGLAGKTEQPLCEMSDRRIAATRLGRPECRRIGRLQKTAVERNRFR
jgi:hypothetical protein